MNRYVQAVVKGSRLTGVAYQALLMLAVHADANGTSYPSVPILARELRCSERALQYGLRQAVQAEELEIQRGNGRGHRSHYTIALEALEKGAKGATTAPFLKGAKGATSSAFPEAERVQSAAPPIPPYKTAAAAADGPSLRRGESERGEQPAPKPNGHPRIQAMVDALRGVGLPDRLTPQERNALLGNPDIPAGEIAACLRAVADHALGDRWDQEHLTVNTAIKLHRGWKTRQQRNGHAGHSATTRAQIERHRQEMLADEREPPARRPAP